MTQVLPKVDVLIIGFGWTGAIMAQELTDAGLNVLALERGKWMDTATDFATTFAQDELRYYWRKDLFEKPAHETLTVRNNAGQTALPMRELGSFLPGTGVGGAGIHWNGQLWRFLPSDFVARSHNLERYGKAGVTDDLTIQDYGVTYNELEPYYDKFEYLCGTSGKAGNLNGVIQSGGDPFEGPRSREYPNPPLTMPYAPTLFAKAAASLGHHPFPHPAANASQAYTNPLGVQLAPCTFCGFCEKYGCGNYSKASAQTTILPVLLRKPNFTLKTESEVVRINLTPDRKSATGVTYVDASGQEFEQPAEMVLLCAYILHNVRLLLLSGIGAPYDPTTGQGVIGKNYSYQITSSVKFTFDDKILNPFIGAGALGMMINDFNGDNFDHSGLGFIGGGYIGVLQTGARPIETLFDSGNLSQWGSDWKHKAAHDYLRSFSISTHGAVMSHRANYLDLDPTYRDMLGRPLMRMTFDYTDNEHRLSDYLTDKATEIAHAMNASSVTPKPRKGSWNVVPYQTTHNTGGAIMGTDPKSSALNRYLQSWDVPNLFVIGATAFPQNAGYNPTGTVAALAYHAADAIKAKYLKAPGQPLVQA
jgi:gluconate 2-dehydrogenase alpha chain